MLNALDVLSGFANTCKPQAASERSKFGLMKSVNIVLVENPVLQTHINPRKPRRNESLQLDAMCLLVSGINGIKPPLQSQILKNG